ncbi:MAG: DNA mismatch repair endonuclease MutL [Oscillospiraceae bacterium]|jgi:DNA mismatch repair protein MutL|nr:DNA mismatch repair endonuclease MutL [Oscillospiraceae bacterium]
MPKINILPREIAQLIAAGEVVERPASVVKELLENAIDAGAQRVTLEITGGGVREIRITDDGHGIGRADVRSAFVSHATSKISLASDLDAICTLGFRGEALASIATVARVELLTHAAGEDVGTRYVIHGGEEVALEDAGCPPGTTFLVQDLFYNTPARMKFLKKDVSEANAVASVVDRIALSHPEVSFCFIREGRQALFSAGDGDQLGAIRAVLGREFSLSLMPVESETDGIRVWGYVSRPSASRPTRSFQFFFLNGRLVKTNTGAAALSEAYKGRLMVGRYPACVLHIEMDETLADVNVHPAKLEVRFADERALFHAVYAAVGLALQASEQQPVAAPPAPVLRATLPPNPHFWGGNPTSATPIPPRTLQVDMDTGEVLEQKAEDRGQRAESLPENVEAAAPDFVEESGNIHSEPNPFWSQANATNLSIKGELFGTYILIEQGRTLLLLDKHAAHERIIYNELKAGSSERFAQQLLAPAPLTLSKEEYAAVLEEADLIRKGGFEFSDLADGTVLVTAAPMEFSADEASAAFAEIAADLLAHKRDPLPAKLDWLYHSISCRAAIKAGDYTAPAELEHFARRVLAEPEIRHCPHGRPVFLSLTKTEIERRIGRSN